MRQEIKLIILVFILVVVPAIAVSFFSGRVLGSWQIVLQKRMETDAVRVLDQAVAAWERQLGQIKESVSSTHTPQRPHSFTFLLSHPWVEGVFVVQPGVGLLYPPSESTTSQFVPPETLVELSAGVFSTNPVIGIQECKRLLQRPGLDPVLGAATLLRLAKAFQMTGAIHEAVLCLKKVAGVGSGFKGENQGVLLRDPEEGFYYDLIALKALADMLDAQKDHGEAGRMKMELLRRVLARYDGIAPLQRELLVEWIEDEVRDPRSEVRDQRAEAQWRERMRGRGLTADDRAKLAQDLGLLIPSLSDGAWIRANVTGREMLLTQIGTATPFREPRLQILAMQFNEPHLISHLNALFAGVTTNTGIRVDCQREAFKKQESGSTQPDSPVLLFSRRLPAPLGSITVAAYPGDSRAFFANARLQTRLYRWGGMLLLISIVAGAWLIWRQAAGEIRQARERSDFAATVSHDLRTPLASMRMLAESLYMGSVGDEAKKQKFLGAIIKESDRLSRLTDRALYFIRYGQSALRYQFTEGDLGALVKDVVETFAVGAGFRVQGSGFREGGGGVPIQESCLALDIKPELPPVRFDGGAMEQVMFNLLDNAVKYSAKGAGVRIEVSLFSTGRTVILSVTDHGDGMTPADVRRVLKPYARGSGGARRNTRGVGLGLALCQHVAKAHGGRIQIESALGKGSTFSIILPDAT